MARYPGYTEHSPSNQKEVLQKLAELTYKSILNPYVRAVALKITNKCPSRNDECELDAIFNAVKNGDPAVKSLSKGFRYVSDPRQADYFTSPFRNLQLCDKGACGGDCDDHAALVAALAGTIGFRVGLRAWGPQKGGPFVHVYAVAICPKNWRPRSGEEAFAVAMDTTVSTATLGWEPGYGRVMTTWVRETPNRG